MTRSMAPTERCTARTVNASSRHSGWRPRNAKRSTAPPAVIAATRDANAPG